MSAALAKNAIALYEGLNKDTCYDLALHKILCDDSSTQKWHWLVKPMEAKGPDGVVEVHED
jgi:hypothetical protein